MCWSRALLMGHSPMCWRQVEPSPSLVSWKPAPISSPPGPLGRGPAQRSPRPMEACPALPAGSFSTSGNSVSRSLFCASRWREGGDPRAGVKGASGAVAFPPGGRRGERGRGGGITALLRVYILDHAVAPKFMRLMVAAWLGYFRFLPQYFPCAQPTPPLYPRAPRAPP